MQSKSWISIEFYRAMFSAVLSSGLSLEKTSLPLSMNLLSNQKLDENTVKHRSNLFHWVSSCICMTCIQQFCWLLDTWVINKFEKFIRKAETSKLNVFQLSTHTCLIFFCYTVTSDISLCSIKPSLHLENGVVVCYIDFSVNFWLSWKIFWSLIVFESFNRATNQGEKLMFCVN